MNGAILGGGSGDNQSLRWRQGAPGRPGAATGPRRAPVWEARGGPGRLPPPCCTLPTAASFPWGSARGASRSRGEAHLLAEALDLGLRQLLALVQLLDPLVQLLGEHLLVHDATRPNRLPLRAAAAPRCCRAAARTRATRTRRRRFPRYLCGCWRLLGASANPRTLPAVPGHQPLPFSARSSPGARLSVMAAAGVVTSRPASGGGRVEGPGLELRNCRANPGPPPEPTAGGGEPGAKAQAQHSPLVTEAPSLLGRGRPEGRG